MTIEELVQIFDKAYCDKLDEAEGTRAGVRAVGVASIQMRLNVRTESTQTGTSHAGISPRRLKKWWMRQDEQ